MQNEHKTTEIHNLRYEILKKIIEEIHRTSEISRMLELTLTNAMSLMNAERGCIMSIKGDVIKDEVCINMDGSEDETRDIAISKSIVKKVFTSGEPLLTHNAMLDQRFTNISSIIKNGVRSVIAVPIKASGETTGVIYIDNRLQNGVFCEEDLQFMDLYAMEISRVIEKTKIEQEKNYIHKILMETVSSEVAEQILKNGLKIDCNGERKEAAVIFADIREFTALSESMNPHALMAILNAFFEKMTDIVMKSRGCLLKFLGDGFMASFGAPVSSKFASEHAVMAGINMVASLSELNEDIKAKYGITIKMGIGIHFGTVTAGVIGGSKRKEYTLIGDVPNTASRLEALTKNHDAQLIVSEAVLRGTNFESVFREIGKVSIRGKKEKMKIYKLAIKNM